MHRAAVNFKLKSLLFRMEVDQEGGVHRSVQGFRRHRLGVYYHRRRLWGPQVRVNIIVSSFLLIPHLFRLTQCRAEQQLACDGPHYTFEAAE